MRFQITVLSFLFLIVSSLAVRSMAQQTAAPGIDLTPDDRIVSGTLETGLRYAVMAAEIPPNEAFVQLYFNVGSLDEPDGQEGIAHFLEHMAFNGSKNVPEDDLVPMLQRAGLSFGADANASTSYDRTIYTLNLPNATPELLDTSLMLMREVAGNLLLEDEAIERERGIIEAERRARKSPGQKAGIARLDYFLKGTRLPERLPIGTVEAVASVNAEQMRAFYHRYYRPENAFLVITGDIEPGEVKAKIDQWFGDWQAVGEAGPTRELGTLSASGDEIGTIFEAGLNTVVSFHGVKEGTKRDDSYETRNRQFRLQLAFAILNRRFQSIARGEQSEILGAGGGAQTIFDIVDIATIQAAAKPDNWEAALVVAITELRRALIHGFDPAELDEAIRIVRTGVRQSVDNADKRHAAGLAGWLISSHAAEAIPTSPLTNAAVFEEALKTITVDTVLATFREVWTGTQSRYFIQGADQPEDYEKRFTAAMQTASTAQIGARENTAVAKFAYTDFGRKGVVAERRFDDRLQTHFIRFENNVRLAIRETDWQEEAINASVRFGDGTHKITTAQPGLGEVLPSAFIAGGLGKHSVNELNRILAGRTASARFNPQFEDFSFTGAFRPEDMDLQFQLWTAFLTDPGYRGEGLAQYRRGLDSRYQNLDITPGQVLSNQGLQHLGSGDPRYGVPPRDKVEGYTEADVSRFLFSSLKEGEIEIAVVGTLEVDAVIESVANTFGALPMRILQDQPNASHWNIPYPQAGKKVFYHKGEVDQTLLRYLWPTHNNSNRQRNIIAYLTARVISDALREKVREELSASYSPTASSSPSSDLLERPGTFSVNIEVAPTDTDTVAAMVEQVIAESIENGVSQDALDRARNPVLADFEEDPRSDSYWLGLLAEAQSRPDLVLLQKERKPIYEAVTVEDIRAYIRTCLGVDKAIVHQVLHESLKP